MQRRSREQGVVPDARLPEGEGFLVVGADSRIVDANPGYCALVKYARGDLVGMNLLDLEAEGSPAQLAGRLERAQTAGQDRYETRHRAHDGTLVDLDVSVTCLS